MGCSWKERERIHRVDLEKSMSMSMSNSMRYHMLLQSVLLHHASLAYMLINFISIS